jgi:hypothetical protein
MNQKLNKELSPSFAIHAKVSEVELPPEMEPAMPEQKQEPVLQTIRPADEPKPVHNDPPKRLASLSIGLNDKFRFINELFSQNNSEYAIAVEQLNNLRNWHDTEVYLNSLKDLYEWKSNSEVVRYFYSMLKKRFE